MALLPHLVRSIQRLAARDHEVGQAPSFRYCALVNCGDEDYAELYAAERRKLADPVCTCSNHQLYQVGCDCGAEG